MALHHGPRRGSLPYQASTPGCSANQRCGLSPPTSRPIAVSAAPQPPPWLTLQARHSGAVTARAATSAPLEAHQKEADQANGKAVRVIIAGAGIGGLVLAVGLLKRGFDVQVLERDVTAIRGEGKYRGPIQVTI